MIYHGTVTFMKKRVSYGLVMSILIILVLLLSGCTEQAAPQSADSIKIGVVASMSGPASTTGKDIWQSAACGIGD